MRNIAPETQARLDDAVATFCHCWRLIRRDGVALGFTDHDVDLKIDATLYSAAGGLDGVRYESRLGLEPGAMEVSGALSAASLDAGDLAHGVYDGASVEIWLVDWRDVSHRILLDVATLGEVRQSDDGFSAELRSITHRLDEVRGRRFQRGCAADLGDAACRIDLTRAAYRHVTKIVSSEATLCVIPSGGFADGWFTNGLVTVRSGPNAGAQLPVKAHRLDGARAQIQFWTPPAQAFAAGDDVELTAGCDKSFATCRAKFANVTNFRGFPHIPGNDALMRYASSQDANMDGGSLFR